MSKKIKVTLPQNIYEIIKNDISDFNMTSNYFMNYIFLNLNDKYKNFKGNPAIAEQSKEKSSIQFNLNKESSLIYYDVLRDNNAQNESEFMRSLLIRYATNPKNKRELFIFKESVERINLAIKDKKNVYITFNDDRKVKVSPYHIGSSDLEIANYIFCYDFSEEKYKNYKLSYLKQVYTTSEVAKWEDSDYIEDMIKNFDPFLSKGQIIKVKLSENGKKLLKTIKINRPKLISEDGDLFEFEASDEQIKRYFSYFFDEATVIEPIELKEWFIEKYENALKNLKNK
ncbi:WYL domain-containing protein [Fusobacterium pseudoperiodonticum]|uniref:Alkaline phosphatase n=1 Tax=Fusobacterium pseudoperiodonticum TaxID=2663009 RepID=A0AAD0AMK1_9FUSO|nr:WYL domain-containing protein [Fusobacterium pseudoperiodonticum]ATV34933.1 WYL domain-containing protein [Fusobacterium pseudoperiodonticum]ATV62173.1 alkaline phosphatase [Fusobacterium pseudoperiodonticum]